LAKGLVNAGHQVTTFACAGSKVPGEVVEVIPDEMYRLLGGFRWDAIAPYEFLAYHLVGSRLADFDVVHNHMGLHPAALASFSRVPFLTTLHSSLPPDFPYLADALAGANYCSISLSQRQLAPQLNYVGNVYHGIDVDTFTPDYRPGAYFLFVGTLSHNKGIDIAIRTAKKLSMPLVIAGEIRESEKAFLDQDVLPYIDGRQVRFVGEANHAEKAALYAGAAALLFPSRWSEAFGLVMAEALACGTPVIALDNGSPAEVIVNGRTGFVVADEPAFVAAAQRFREISREACRQEAEQRFSLPVMAQRYVEIYQLLKK
jgi:glycosyltransferase involved in cell wall biosynthesis